MKSRIVRVGNSRGVRIPKVLLEQSGLVDEVDLEASDGIIIIRVASPPGTVRERPTGDRYTVPQFTASERVQLQAMARRKGMSPGELIHQAVSRLLSEEGAFDRLALLEQARGMWRDRSDLPDFAALRHEFDRFREQAP